MSYGIGGMAAGFNQGIRQRQEHDYRREQDAYNRQRQEAHDAMARERHDESMAASQQQYGIRDDMHDMRSQEFDAWRSEQDRLADMREIQELSQNALRDYHAGQPQALTPLIRTIYDLPDDVPIHWDFGDDQVSMDIDGKPVQMSREKFEAYLRDFSDPGTLQQFVSSQRERLYQERQSEEAHDRDIQARLASRGPSERVTQNEEGRFGLLDPSEVPAGSRGNPTALERNTEHYIRVFGMDERTATLAAQGRLRSDEARREARRLATQFIDPSSPFNGTGEFVHQNPEVAREIGITETTEPLQAIHMLEEHLAGMFASDPETFYGVQGGSGSGELMEIDRVVSEAAQAIQRGARPEAIEQRLRERGYPDNYIRQVMGSL